MTNSYLDIAEKAIRIAQRPLRPKEILSLAKEQGFMPESLGGLTQYKTMAARLSTEIRSYPEQSIFYRTGANLFFLREFADGEHVEYLAPKREKTLHAESVLTIPTTVLDASTSQSLVFDVRSFLHTLDEADAFEYIHRRDAEKRYDVKQVIAYALIYRRGELLTYRRGSFTNAADELLGLRSIGFGGHVTDVDANLFDTHRIGVIENARREISEELVVDGFEMKNLSLDSSFSYLCAINTNESDEAKKHIAITLVYFCSTRFEAEKNEMSVKDLRWEPLLNITNNLDDFEPWSQLILEHLYTGKLKIDRE